MFNYNSPYKKHNNTELKWLPMDTEELYKKNFVDRYSDLNDQGWINYTPFTYKFNSHGFRCEEFTSAPTIMFLGCSNTVGIGLPVECIWPEIVSKNLNMSCANLGVGGTGPDTAFRLCLGWIDKINPSIVIFNKPPPGRLELFIDQSPTQLHSNSSTNCPDFFKFWTLCENNNYFNYQKNLLGIKMLCFERNIKFIEVDSASMRSSFSGVSLARDLAHPGKEIHQNFANNITQHI